MLSARAMAARRWLPASPAARRRRRAVFRVATALAAAAATAACSDRSPGDGDAFAVRGVIEGFYGRPYTTAERARVIRFIGERGMNAYVYAPKSDPKHRDQWREPYSDAELADFAELATAGDHSGVRLTFAISPGITYRTDDPTDFDLLAAKLEAVHDAGVRGFALLFDDIFDAGADALAEPDFQARLTARVDALVASFGDDSELWFIGHLYAGTGPDLEAGAIDRRLFLAPNPPAAYYDAYAALVAPEVPILWTGPQVISSSITRADAEGFRAFARRPVIVWDNYPANDVFPTDLFMGPYTGRDRELDAAARGIVMNVMIEPAATLVPVATGADYMRDPRGYDPEASWEKAVRDVGGSGAAALRDFAELHRGHPFLAGAVEAPELGGRIAAAFAPDASERDRSALRDQLATIAGLEAAIGGISDGALAADVAPWAHKASLLARAGLNGLDAIAGTGSADAYAAARAEAEALPQLVARDDVSPAIAAIAGPGHPTDRFGDLFGAIDARLDGAASSGPHEPS